MSPYEDSATGVAIMFNDAMASKLTICIDFLADVVSSHNTRQSFNALIFSLS